MPKRAQKPQPIRTCTYCGVAEDQDGPRFTRDHVLPRSLFNTMDPQMITVLACPACQQEKSYGDDDLRDYVNLHHGGSHHPEALTQLFKIARATQLGRSKIGQAVRTKGRLRQVVTQAGLHVPMWEAPIPGDHRDMFRSLEYIVRGLYYHTTRTALPLGTPVSVMTVEDWDIVKLFTRVPHRGPTIKGNGVAWWVSAHTDEDPLSTYWLLLFNDAIWFLAGTGQFAHTNDESKDPHDQQRVKTEAKQDVEAEHPEPGRTIVGQTHTALQSYAYAEFRDSGIRRMTAEWPQDLITLWLWGMRLFEGAFTPGLLYNCGQTDPKSDECEAYWDRHALLSLGARGAKPALDLLLAGHYVESWAVERAMLESWIRAVYLRLQPAEHPRFREYAKPHGCEPQWRDAAKAIRQHGDEIDAALLDQAQLRWRFLNLGAHPSGEGIALQYDEERRLLRFYPDPNEHMAATALFVGIFVQHALLKEVERLRPPVQQVWFDDRARFSESAAPVFAFSERLLRKWRERHEQRCLQRSGRACGS